MTQHMATDTGSRRAKSVLNGIFRPAVISDARQIFALINQYANKELMIRRALSELIETIREYIIYEEDGQLIGACGLHIALEELAELRALAVRPGDERRGIGSELARLALGEAERLGLPKVFALTYNRAFFERLGFVEIDKNLFPHKVWGECVKCHKFPECDEVGMIIELTPTPDR